MPGRERIRATEERHQVTDDGAVRFFRTAREPAGFYLLSVAPDSCCLLLAYETWRPPIFQTNFEQALS